MCESQRVDCCDFLCGISSDSGMDVADRKHDEVRQTTRDQDQSKIMKVKIFNLQSIMCS